MTRADTLRLLLIAEIPSDLETIEASALAIAARLDVLDRDSPDYERVHTRLNDLLSARERALADDDTPTTNGAVSP